MREASGGGAHVDADASLGRNGERLQSVRELVAAAADELLLCRELQIGAGSDEGAGLVHALAVHGDGAGQEEASRLLATVAQSPRHESDVDALLDLRLPGRHSALELTGRNGTRPLHGRLLHAISFLQPMMRSRNSWASPCARSRSPASAMTWKIGRSASGIAATQSSPMRTRTPSISSTSPPLVASMSRRITAPLRSSGHGTSSRVMWLSGTARVRVTSKPYSAAMRSTAREAVTGTTIRPGGRVRITRRATRARARSPGSTSPFSSTRNTFSPPVSRSTPRSAPRVRTMFESCWSDRWNSSDVFEMRLSSRYALRAITSTPSAPRTEGKIDEAEPKA